MTINLSAIAANISALATDTAGNLFVGGTFRYTADIGGGAMTAATFGDGLFAKLDSALGYVWAVHHSGTGTGDYVLPANVIVDPGGGLTSAGFYSSNDLDFGLGKLPTGQGSFVVRFDSTDAMLASFGMAAQTAPLWVRAAARSGSPDVLIAGQCSGPVTLPSGSFSCGVSTAVAARLEP